jgi:type II secretory pathway pseudopilin PulG
MEKRTGFTLIEILIYTGILVLLVAVTVSTLLALSRSYRTLSAAQQIESGAELSLERMLRETRDATSIDATQSTFTTSPGVLTLNTTDEAGATTSVQFFLSGQKVRMKEAGVDQGPLTPTLARITSLIFRRIMTANSQAIKVEMTIESGQGPSYRTKNFYGTAVLRGSYPTQ